MGSGSLRRCLARLIGVGLFAFVVACSGCDGPSLNDVSRYAQRCHDLLYADAMVAGYFMHADKHSPQELYDLAKRLSDDAGTMATAIDAPSGFDDSGQAWGEYAQAVSDSYGKIANDLNDPSLANTHEMAESIQALNPLLKKAMVAFKRDLASAPFTKQEKRRILDRLM